MRQSGAPAADALIDETKWEREREDVEANLNLLELLAPAASVGKPPSTADPICISRSTHPCCFCP